MGRLRGDLVDPPADSDDATRADLVAHRVGERLPRVGAGDLVAVDDEPHVEVAQELGSVTAEDLAAGGAQVPTPEPFCLGVDRGQRLLVGIRWTQAAAVRHPGPEQLSHRRGLPEQLEPAAGQLGDGVVHLGQVGDQGFADHLVAVPSGDRTPGSERVDPIVSLAAELRVCPVGGWGGRHDLAPFAGSVSGGAGPGRRALEACGDGARGA
jgi:hypothetical protein